MISFKQFLIEILTGGDTYPTVDRTSDTNSLQFGKYSFAVDDKFTYIVNLKKSGTTYSLDFYAIEGSYRKIINPYSGELMFKPLKRYKHSYYVSNSTKIYNTIAKIIREQIGTKITSGEKIWFEAASTQTHKLYAMFARKIAKEIDGEVKDSGSYWTITKK